MKSWFVNAEGNRISSGRVQDLVDGGDLVLEPDVLDDLPGDLPAQPAAFGRVRHISFFDFEEAELLSLERGRRGWRCCQALLEGEYYADVYRIGVVERPWAFLVNAIREGCWRDVVVEGVTAEEEGAILRAAGWDRSDE